MPARRLRIEFQVTIAGGELRLTKDSAACRRELEARRQESDGQE